MKIYNRFSIIANNRLFLLLLFDYEQQSIKFYYPLLFAIIDCFYGLLL